MNIVVLDIAMSVKLCQCYKSIKEPHVQCHNPAKAPDYQYCGLHMNGHCHIEKIRFVTSSGSTRKTQTLQRPELRQLNELMKFLTSVKN